jgi:5-methyltetrahydrofolate--homocysteine methyltransferase
MVLNNYPLEELRETIDWTPFFQTWELAGKYPAILQDPVVGDEARKLFDDANRVLDELIAGKKLQANGCFFILPAQRHGEDVAVFNPQHPDQKLADFHFLRQQRKMSNGVPNLSLADFMAPEGDYLGGFAVTAGIGLDKLVAVYEAEHDDYHSILVKALADRLAESFAETLHRRVRREFWAYAPAEQLNNQELIRERYRGIRPAPGYPACPEHTEKATLFSLLKAEEVCGIKLTESMAMMPAAAVSGWYFAHPEARYFGLGKIGKDQVQDYAARKGWTMEEAERWLSPVLAY